MESDTRLMKDYVQNSDTVITVRTADFWKVNDDSLPRITSLIDGLSRKQKIESREETRNEYSNNAMST